MTAPAAGTNEFVEPGPFSTGIDDDAGGGAERDEDGIGGGDTCPRIACGDDADRDDDGI